MPTKGQIIENPHMGFKVEFVETAADTNGQRVCIKSTVGYKGALVPNHLHVLQEETFEVISGNLTIQYEGKKFALGTGEKITLPKGKPHNHYNNHDEPVVYHHIVTPALDFDYFIENIVSIGRDAGIKDGNLGMLQQLVILKYLDSKAYLADAPIAIQNIMMNTLGPIARLLGYRAVYKKYSGIEK